MTRNKHASAVTFQHQVWFSARSMLRRLSFWMWCETINLSQAEGKTRSRRTKQIDISRSQIQKKKIRHKGVLLLWPRQQTIDRPRSSTWVVDTCSRLTTRTVYRSSHAIHASGRFRGEPWSRGRARVVRVMSYCFALTGSIIEPPTSINATRMHTEWMTRAPSGWHVVQHWRGIMTEDCIP